MPVSLVLDTSVLVAAVLPREPGHSEAAALMGRLSTAGAAFAAPALVLPELSGALRRNGRPLPRIREYLHLLHSPMTEIWPIDAVLADLAAEIALLNAIKGSDAIFLALSRALAIPLVTLDKEQQDRAPADVEVFTPGQALAHWS